jgi:hypothetical protein
VSDEHKSDFEAFVREALTDLRGSQARLADAIWDILPRMTKVERTVSEHGESIAAVEARLRSRSTPPKGLGKVSDTGSHIIYDVQTLIEQHDVLADGKAYRALKGRTAGIIGTVIASALGALILFLAGVVYHRAYGNPAQGSTTTIVAPASSR